ncbi:concanavalin A-like lectin/glucanase [Apiospora kogelbergensis]|uniref:concanavalin A-like lectin/glucanase n=1 Tax=Apiospora kogelbergensis TaxID=1337665 RepID=UPI00312F5C70
MPSPGWIPAVLASCLVAVVVCYPLTTDSNCTCYQTNETASQFLTHHKFFDFRSLPQYVNVPKAIEDPALSAGADVTSSYFSTADWQSWWQIQSWNNSDTLQRGNQTNATISDATVFMVNSPSNIYFERNTDARPASQTYLTMRTARHTTFQSAAEFESVALDYRYLSVRMKARTKGPRVPSPPCSPTAPPRT